MPYRLTALVQMSPFAFCIRNTSYKFAMLKSHHMEEEPWSSLRT